jgi:hypothetical protein
MEKLIHKIINLDKEAKNYCDQYEKKIEEDKIAFEAKLQAKKDDFNRVILEERNALMKAGLAKAAVEAEVIRVSYEKEYSAIKESYQKERERIIDESFIEIKEQLLRGV